MKKTLLLIALLVAGIGNSQAQKKFDIRAYGGVNLMQLTSDEGTTLFNGVIHDQKVSGRPGYQFGLAATFGARFFVQPGFQYTYMSTKIVNENTATGFEFEDNAQVKMISVPLKVGFRLINPETENLVNVRVFGGLDGHHVIDVKHSDKSGIKVLEKEDYSNMILNADFGLGLDIFIFYVDFGYQLGLTPVHSASGDNAKANSFYGNFGLKFSF